MSHPRVEEVSDSSSNASNSDPDEVSLDDDFNDSDILLQRSAAAPQTNTQIPRNAPVPAPQNTQQTSTTADRAKYADFQCLYPVYWDVNRSRAQGRRVGVEYAVKDPLAREVANACSRLGLPTLLEPDKVHPKDWSNPGRVKVGLKKAGSSSGAKIHNKHHLFIMISKHLQENPTEDDSIGLRVRMGGQLQPEQGKPYPKPAVPRGWKMGERLPYMSGAMTGGGVSENLFKDMMKGMQGGGDPMSALMGGAAAGGAGSDGEGAGGGKKKKDKKKKKGKA